MKTNPLAKIETFGQSIWLDYIKRDLFNGELKKFIDEDDLRGMTSNPSIFQQAIGESNEYDKDIARLVKEGKNADQIYDILTQHDVGTAADIFLPVYKKTNGLDGYVSLEVNPNLAHDTNLTLKEARRLWSALNRPNVLIKVPATKEGIPAIEQLIAEGINVNVTLLFGLSRYQEVAEAYIAGLSHRISQGKSIAHIASVASFFLSRIDVLLDPIFTSFITPTSDKAKLAESMLGQIAIASAKNAYSIFNQLFFSDKFKKLVEKGAHVQRLLWASTSTKNPAYSDVKYVEALIGPLTVNTIPLETLNAYRDHGCPKLTLETNLEAAKDYFLKLTEFNIVIDKVTQQLEDEGVVKFIKSYTQLMDTLQQAMHK